MFGCRMYFFKTLCKYSKSVCNPCLHEGTFERAGRGLLISVSAQTMSLESTEDFVCFFVHCVNSLNENFKIKDSISKPQDFTST